MVDESPASGESAAADDAGGASADQGSSVDFAVAAENRQIVSRGTINVRVDDLDAAMEEIQVLVDDVDGLVFAEETDLRDGAVTRITLKVPPTAFRAALASLADLGEVQTQTVSTDDVTEQVVDLDSRIATSEASVIRLRALLDRAERIQDITQIEGQLLERETELETLRGQRRTIEGQVALATVDVTLRAERTSPPPPEPVEDAQTGFPTACGAGPTPSAPSPSACPPWPAPSCRGSPSCSSPPWSPAAGGGPRPARRRADPHRLTPTAGMGAWGSRRGSSGAGTPSDLTVRHRIRALTRSGA